MNINKNLNLNPYYLKNFITITDNELNYFKNDLIELLQLFDIQVSNIKAKIECNENTNRFTCSIMLDENPKYCIIGKLSGEIYMIYEMIPVNTQQIIDNCILKQFPIHLDQYQLKYNSEYELECNGDKINLINLYGDVIKSHYPFYSYLGNENNYADHDKWIRLPYYDTNGMLAFIANRYAWGMNITCCLFDPKLNNLYYGNCYNFDYPEGIALKQIDKKKIQIYLNNDKLKRNILYKNDEKYVFTFEIAYKDSNWYNFDISFEYKFINNWLKLIHSNPNLKLPTDVYYCVEGLMDELNSKKEYNRAIDICKFFLKNKDILDYPYKDEYMNSLVLIKYNLMCFYSLTKNIEKALECLEEIKDHWDDIDHIMVDTDLDNLRDNERFKTILSYMESLEIE